MFSYDHVQYQKKTNNPILRKHSDGWTDGCDQSDFIGCPTNYERAKLKYHKHIRYNFSGEEKNKKNYNSLTFP